MRPWDAHASTLAQQPLLCCRDQPVRVSTPRGFNPGFTGIRSAARGLAAGHCQLRCVNGGQSPARRRVCAQARHTVTCALSFAPPDLLIYAPHQPSGLPRLWCCRNMISRAAQTVNCHPLRITAFNHHTGRSRISVWRMWKMKLRRNGNKLVES